MAQVRYMSSYSTSQTSGDSTVDMYWDMVNNRYTDITNKVAFAQSARWINGAISDAEQGIKIINIIDKFGYNKLLSNYKSTFLLLIKELKSIKEGLSK